MQQISRGKRQIMGRKRPRENFFCKAMVDVLDHAVNSARQLAFFVEIIELTEMSAVLIVFQGVLNIPRDCAVDIFVGALFGRESRIVVIDAADAHCATVADIVVNALNAENLLKLAVRD